MTKLKNPKADLLWEATRRNENYKKGYYDALKIFQKKYPDQPRENFKRLPSPDTDRWKIKMVGPNPIEKKWCTFCWLDPDVQLKEIWEDIIKRDSLWMHPYNHLFQDEEINAALRKNLAEKTGEKYGKVFLQSYYCSEMHGIEKFDNYERILQPQNISDDLMLEDFFEFEADNTVYAAIKRENTKNKILLMIDPFEIDDNIEIKIKEIKNEVIQSLKAKIETLEKQGKAFIEPSKIGYCLNWFKIYDKIIEYAYEKSNLNISCIDGAKCLKIGKHSSLEFGEVIPHTDLDKDDYDNKGDYNNATDKRRRADIKKAKPAYETSVKLIQQTPNIFFSPKIKSKK
ncbi:MAG: hypothetical protein ABIJ59_06775 [Pseudomonadota bacterium]